MDKFPIRLPNWNSEAVSTARCNAGIALLCRADWRLRTTDLTGLTRDEKKGWVDADKAVNLEDRITWRVVQ
jgi:hypothetical protein